MYPTVTEFFKAEYPDLADYLDNKQSAFWSGAEANTISNDELAGIINMPRPTSMVYQAALAIMIGRLTKKISNPD